MPSRVEVLGDERLANAHCYICVPASWLLIEAGQPLVEEALAPLTNDVVRGVQGRLIGWPND
jgi:hypothetical protein